MYKYEEMKEQLFSEAGSIVFIRVRDRFQLLFECSGNESKNN